jgi:hypothetical protein
MAVEELKSAEPHSATTESQDGIQRPWWHRMFGG